MVIAANKKKDKDKGILTEFNFPYTVEAFRLQSRYRFARESFSSENILYKNNRDNRAGEIKLNASFRGAYFFSFFWGGGGNKRIKILNQISSWSSNL